MNENLVKVVYVVDYNEVNKEREEGVEVVA
jgi:hypothetical protein